MLILSLAIVVFIITYQNRMISYQLQITDITQQKQIEIITASVKGEEEERRRIALELHDDVGISLASARLFLHSAAQLQDEELLQQSKDLVDEAMVKIRSISHRLQPDLLRNFGLKSALKSTVSVLNKSGKISIEFHDEISMPHLEYDIELAVYRITQELLNNLIKHAHPKKVNLNVEVRINKLILSFLHDGKGIVHTDYIQLINKKDAIGLKNISGRLKLFNGDIQFDMNANEIFVINLTIPI